MPDHDHVRTATLAHLNYLEYARELARWSGRAAEVSEQDGLLLVASGTTFPVLFNAAARLDRAIPPAEVIERADAWFRERERGYTITAAIGFPGGDDADLHDPAVAAGFADVFDSPAMVCRAPVEELSLPPGTELRWMTDDQVTEDFLAVNSQAYSTLGMPKEIVGEAITATEMLRLPHIHAAVIYVDGAPAAAAQVVLSHGIAGVYWVGTREEARGKGLGDLVTRAVTNRGFELGATFASLQASPMGDPIYRRMGYEEIYRYQNLVRFEPPR